MYPRKFILENVIREEKRTAFVLIPFSETFRAIYDVISRTLQNAELGMTCYRADEIYRPEPIIETILRGILTAEIIIADATGRNANVFYELGISHAVKDKCIILTQTMDDVPFDLRHLRCIVYENSVKGAEGLRVELTKAVHSALATAIVYNEPEGAAWSTTSIAAAASLIPSVTSLNELRGKISPKRPTKGKIFDPRPGHYSSDEIAQINKRVGDLKNSYMSFKEAKVAAAARDLPFFLDPELTLICALLYFNDIKEFRLLYDTAGIDYRKQAAYLSRWISKMRPIQYDRRLAASGITRSTHMAFLNEDFATFIFYRLLNVDPGTFESAFFITLSAQLRFIFAQGEPQKELLVALASATDEVSILSAKKKNRMPQRKRGLRKRGTKRFR